MPRWNEEAGEGRTTELLEGNHGIVKLLILIHGHLLLLHSAQTCVTPIELIHTPKRVDGQEEAVHWVLLKSTPSISEPRLRRVYSRGKINDHPTHKHELSLDGEDQSLHGTSASIRTHGKKQRDVPVSRKCSKHDEGNLRQSKSSDCDKYDQEGAQSQARKTDGKHVHKQR